MLIKSIRKKDKRLILLYCLTVKFDSSNFKISKFFSTIKSVKTYQTLLKSKPNLYSSIAN